MSDLISRQALCEYALNQKDKSITPNEIMRFPSAEPVRHGKWIWKGEDGDSRWMCSECKCKEYVPTCNGVPNIWNYCPNCGADMRGEINE